MAIRTSPVYIGDNLDIQISYWKYDKVKHDSTQAILSVDPGRSLGYALFHGDDLILSGIVKSRIKQPSLRIASLSRAMWSVCLDEKVHKIIIEEPYKITKANAALGTLFSDLKYTGQVLGIDVVTYPPTIWRRLIGLRTKKTQNKEHVAKILIDKYNIKTDNLTHDEVDAIGLGFAFIEEQHKND